MLYPLYSDERVVSKISHSQLAKIRAVLGAQGHMKGHVIGRHCRHIPLSHSVQHRLLVRHVAVTYPWNMSFCTWRLYRERAVSKILPVQYLASLVKNSFFHIRLVIEGVRNFRSGSSSYKILHEWLDTHQGNNRTNDRNNALSHKTMTAATL